MRCVTLRSGMLAATAAGLLIGTAALAQQPDRNRGAADVRGRANLNLDTRGNQQGARINGRVNAGNRAGNSVGVRAGNNVGVRAGNNVGVRAGNNVGVDVRARGNRFDGRQQRGFRGNRGNWNRRNGVGVGVFIDGGRRSSFYRNPGYSNGYYSGGTYYPGNGYTSRNYRSYGGSYYTGSSHAGYTSGPCASGVQHQSYVQGSRSPEYQERGYRPDFDAQPAARRPGFGVSFDDTADGVVRIAHVYPNSPAARAGIQVGDVLVGLNGQQIRGDWQGTVSQIRGMSPGDELNLTVQRDGQEQQLNAELATWDEAFAARDQQQRTDDAPPAPDADLNGINPADQTEPIDPNDRTIPSTPDQPGLENNAETPDQPKLNENSDKPATDIDAETPATTPKNPNLPELPDTEVDVPEVDAPESATETIDQPKQE